MTRLLTLLLLVLGCYSKSYWDTLPVGIHGGIRNRPASDIAALTKFSVVVVDPIEGPECTSPFHASCNASAADCAVENNIVGTLKKVKALDSSVTTMAYLNSILMMPYFALSKKMYANASKLLLRDQNSKIITFAGDGGTGFFCSDFPTYDLTQEAAVAAILADFAAMNSSGAVDGIYLDKSATWPGYGDSPGVAQGKNSLCQHECYTMTPTQTTSYIAGRLSLFRGFDQACGTSGICSMDARIVNVPQVASMVNHYIPRSIHIFRAAVKTSYTNATVNFVRGLEGKTEHLLWYGTCQKETEVAFFLVMAWPGCYCMTFSNDDTAQQLWSSGWHYATHLGAPKGPAEFVNGKTWVRHFAGGAQARYDLRTGNGKVIWP